MAESQIHINFVRKIKQWILVNYGEHFSPFIYTDLPENSAQDIPPNFEGYRPDLYLKRDEVEIIGEAKTKDDIERDHSRSQFLAFLKHLENKKDGLMILAVPWHCVPMTESLIELIIKKNNIKNVNFFVLEKLSEES